MKQQQAVERAQPVAEVAAQLSLSKWTVYRYLERGLVRGIRLPGGWRVLPGEIDRLAREYGNAAARE